MKNNQSNRSYEKIFDDLDTIVQKMDSGEISLEKSLELFEKGILITPFHVIVKPIARFVKHYIIKLGLLDGFYGFIISFALSYGVLVRYIKLWNLKQRHRKNDKSD